MILAIILAPLDCGWTDIACHGDTLGWHFLWALGLFFWMLNRLLLVSARSIESIASWLTVGEDSVLASIFGSLAESLWTPLWLIVGAALLVFGICYALQAIIEQNWVNARRASRNFLFACLVLTLGSTLLSEAETFRSTTGKLLSDIVREGLVPTTPIQFLVAGDGINMPSGSIYDPEGQTCPNMNILRSSYLVYLSDYAANFLLANGRDIHCPANETSFPIRSGSTVSFQEVFIPTDIGYGEGDKDARANARQLLTMGIIRLMQGLILSLAAVIEQALYAILALSLAMTWFSLILGLLMGMFSAAEGLVTASTQAIVTILKVSWISSLVMGIMAALMQQAVASGSGLAVVGMGSIGLILAGVQLWSGISAGKVALSATSTVLGGGPQMLMGALGAAAGLGTGMARGYGSMVKDSLKPSPAQRNSETKQSTETTQSTQGAKGPKGETIADMADKPIPRLPPRTVEAAPQWYETSQSTTPPSAPAPQKPVEAVPTSVPVSQKPVDATTSPRTTQVTASAQPTSQREPAPTQASLHTTVTPVSAGAPPPVVQMPPREPESLQDARTEQRKQPASAQEVPPNPSPIQTPTREVPQTASAETDPTHSAHTTDTSIPNKAQTMPVAQERPAERAVTQGDPEATLEEVARSKPHGQASFPAVHTTQRATEQVNIPHDSQTLVPTNQEPAGTPTRPAAAPSQANTSMSNTATVADMAAPAAPSATQRAIEQPNTSHASQTAVQVKQEPAETYTHSAAAPVSDVAVPSPPASSQPVQEPTNGNAPTSMSPGALQTSQESADAPNTTQESQTGVSTNQEAAQVAPPPFDVATASHVPVPTRVEQTAAPVAEGQQPVTTSSAPSQAHTEPIAPSVAAPTQAQAESIAPLAAAPTVPSLPASIRSRLSREPTTAVPVTSQPIRTHAETLEALTKPPEAVEALRMRGTK
jgi:hypothetical protein